MRIHSVPLTSWRGRYPTDPASVFLNVNQLSALLDIPVSRTREAYQRDAIKPDAFDGRASPLFALARVHEFADATEAPGLGEPYVLKLTSPLMDPVLIRVDPPQT